MTKLDLRIEFKLETGEYPAHWYRNYTSGNLTTNYGLWLEEKFGDFRQEYLFETGQYASHINDNYKRKWKVKNPIRLFNNYTEWLENKILSR